jgi:UPF0716 protein FxsA
MRARWIAIGFVLLPAVEIAGFIAVASLIGFPWVLVLTIATSVVGALILQRAGRAGAERLAALARGQVPNKAAKGGDVAFFVAGILLLIPGFASDVAGALLLFVPALRRWLGATIRRAIVASARPASTRAPAAQPASDTIVDLSPDQWRQVPDQDQPLGRAVPPRVAPPPERKHDF